MMESKRILTMPRIKNRMTCETTFDCTGLMCADCLVSGINKEEYNRHYEQHRYTLPVSTTTAPGLTTQEKSITKAPFIEGIVYRDSNTGLHCVYCGRKYSYDNPKHSADCPVPIIQKHYAE